MQRGNRRVCRKGRGKGMTRVIGEGLEDGD